MLDSASSQFSGISGEVPQFWWTKDQACELVTWEPLSFGTAVGELPPLVPPAFLDQSLLENVRREHTVLVCPRKGERYEPLQDEPSLYLYFAATFLVPDNDQELRDAAVRFVNWFGLPRREPAFEDVYGQPAVPLQSFLNDAARVALAVQLLAACYRAETEGDSRFLEELLGQVRTGNEPEASPVLGATGTLMNEALYWLGGVLTVELSRVRLVPLPDVQAMLDEASRLPPGEAEIPLSTIRLKPSFTCDDLLAAMWLQVYLAATEQRLVSLRCKGCGRPFEVKDRRQEYCDPHCRHATNQRSFYERKKQKRQEAQS